MPIMPVAVERVCDHRAIPRLEDVQRQEDAGEEDDVGKGNRGDRHGDSDRVPSDELQRLERRVDELAASREPSIRNPQSVNRQ